MEFESSRREQPTLEQVALKLWNNTSPHDRRPPSLLSTVADEVAYSRKGREDYIAALSVHADEIRAELDAKKLSRETQMKRGFPPHYKAVIFVNDYVSDMMLGWSLRKYDPSHPEKFAFWYQQYVGANFLLRYETFPVESLRGTLPAIYEDNERLTRAVLSPDKPQPDPEDTTVAMLEARKLEDLLLQDASGFLLADKALADATQWGREHNYPFVSQGAEFAVDLYKRVYELTNPSQPRTATSGR